MCQSMIKQSLQRVKDDRQFTLLCVLSRVMMMSLVILTISMITLSERAYAQESNLSLSSRPSSFADLAERLLPTVVNIATTQIVRERRYIFRDRSPFNEFFDRFFRDHNRRRFKDSTTRKVTALGSGFVIDAEKGLVLTNYHVIKDADQISVILQDETILEATVVGHDDKTDIALLRVETDHILQEVTFGNSDDIRVGDWVLAIGNPFGLGGTVTAGIVSARGRVLNNGPYIDYLQTDASINRGNSGGPMFNLDGEVIGMNTLIISPSGGSVGIGFAIPSLSIQWVLDQLIEYGQIRRGWIGVQIQEVTEEIAETLNLSEPVGALVVDVISNGPASRAGLQARDVILKFNNTDIRTMLALPGIVAQTEIGATVEVVIWRDNEEKVVQLIVGELEQESELADSPQDSVPLEELIFLGLTLEEITPESRQQYDISQQIKGVLISDVQPDTHADRGGIRPGNVITHIDDQEITTLQDVSQVIQRTRETNKSSILLRIRLNRGYRFIALPLSHEDR